MYLQKFVPTHATVHSPTVGIHRPLTQNKIMKNTKTLRKLTNKDYLEIVIFVITFIIALTIFSDWEHFKAGLFGF